MGLQFWANRENEQKIRFRLYIYKMKGKLMKITNESGRSMVEMLGVLAIIGVLSIGGIAGYTTAMNRYRANEVVDMATKYATIAFTTFQTYGARTSGEAIDATKIPAFVDTGLASTSKINGASYAKAVIKKADGKTAPANASEGVKVSILITFNANDKNVCKAAASAMGYKQGSDVTASGGGFSNCENATPQITFITNHS